MSLLVRLTFQVLGCFLNVTLCESKFHKRNCQTCLKHIMISSTIWLIQVTLNKNFTLRLVYCTQDICTRISMENARLKEAWLSLLKSFNVEPKKQTCIFIFNSFYSLQYYNLNIRYKDSRNILCHIFNIFN